MTDTNDKGNLFANFGKAAFATLGLTIDNDHPGNTVTIHLGERCNNDKTVHKEPGVSNIAYHKTTINLLEGKHYYQVMFPQRPPSYYLHTQDLADHYPEVIPFRCAEIAGKQGTEKCCLSG